MNMHVMQVMDSNGHTTVTWDPADPASINEAKREFQRLITSGYSAFRMNMVHENDVVVEEQGERISEFDPKAGKVMMVPHLRGG